MTYHPSPASPAGISCARAGRVKKGMSLHQSSAAEPFRPPRHIRTNVVLYCPCAAQHQPRRTSAIHPQRACNLAVRLLHKTPNQQDMSFSRMQDAEAPPPQDRPSRLTDPPSPPRASVEAQSGPWQPFRLRAIFGRSERGAPEEGHTRLGLSRCCSGSVCISEAVHPAVPSLLPVLAMSPARQLRNSRVQLANHILADIPYSSSRIVRLTLSGNFAFSLGLAPVPE